MSESIIRSAESPDPPRVMIAKIYFVPLTSSLFRKSLDNYRDTEIVNRADDTDPFCLWDDITRNRSSAKR